MATNLTGSGRSGQAAVVRSPAEWRALMADYEASGLTQVKFCQSRGVSRKTFQSWRRRLGLTGTTPFVELTPPLVGSWDVELELGDGMVLRVRRPGC